jgi:thioredoxin reductase (NADPH)
MDTSNVYDIIIIGGGPGGLSAALYGARSELKTLLLEAGLLGGQIATTTHVQNYPGSIKDCTGPRLIERMEEQAVEFGAEIAYDMAQEISKEGDLFTVKISAKKSYQAKTVIVALGASPKMLGIPGEAEYRGRGVSYCATCDGGFFKGKDIAVIGGGDTALQEAMFLTKYASKVYIVHRRDEFRGCKSLESRARKNPKIEMVLNSLPQRIAGTASVEGLEIKNKITEELSTLNVSGVFLFVGYKPNTDLVAGLIDLDDHGYALAGADMSTKIPGLYAIGDMTKKPLRQAVTAAADGAIASISAEKYIDELDDKQC